MSVSSSPLAGSHVVVLWKLQRHIACCSLVPPSLARVQRISVDYLAARVVRRLERQQVVGLAQVVLSGLVLDQQCPLVALQGISVSESSIDFAVMSVSSVLPMASGPFDVLVIGLARYLCPIC